MSDKSYSADDEGLSLKTDQAEAFKLLVSGANVLLTGQAGSGKTYLLNRYIRYLKERNIKAGLTASTGIAATHINGQTIHSWAGFGIKETLTKAQISRLCDDINISDRIGKAKVLVIDEISMLHDYQLDMVDQICRAVRESAKPFGGLQVVLCGDFHQLPPVSKDNRSVGFVTKSRVWSEMELEVCYLTSQHRQTGGELLTILNEIRIQDLSDYSFEMLSSRLNATFASGIEPTKLCTHNSPADAYNLNKLEQTKGEEQVYRMKSGGKSKFVWGLKRDCLAPEELRLKKGAVVMFVRNNKAKGYFNGTTGKVVGFDEDNFPIVEIFKTKRRVTVGPEKWSIDENFIPIAWISQLPLRLAWAITIHKCQGMTLDYARIDLSRSFTYSLGYVALSRVRSLDGISLEGFNQLALMVSEEAIEIDRMLKNASALNSNQPIAIKSNHYKDLITKREDLLSQIAEIDRQIESVANNRI